MRSLQRIWAVFVTRNKEFYRDRATLGWSLLFPLFILFGMALVFSDSRQAVFEVGLLGSDTLLEAAPEAADSSSFFATPHVQWLPLPNSTEEERADADLRVRQHRIDLLVDPVARRYWVNATSAAGTLAERLLQSAPDTADYERGEVTGREIRYIDWLVPGLLSMNMMFGALFGVGYVLVRYRKNGVLRRLKATPLSAFEFLTAQIGSRMMLLVVTTTVVYLGSDLILDFTMIGSHLLLLSILILGSLCLISMGLVIAARTASEELANGLLNVATFPMIGLSGVWFSIESAPRWLHWVAQALPLTHVNDAARAVMTEGAGLATIAPNLLTLAAMSVIFLAVGAALFRWE